MNSPSRHGHYEWQDFRQQPIGSIAVREAAHAQNDPDWDYYQRWLLALERLLQAQALVDDTELERRTMAILDELQCCHAAG